MGGDVSIPFAYRVVYVRVFVFLLQPKDGGKFHEKNPDRRCSAAYGRQRSVGPESAGAMLVVTICGERRAWPVVIRSPAQQRRIVLAQQDVGGSRGPKRRPVRRHPLGP